MKFVAKPVIVEAEVIISCGKINPDGSMNLTLQNGENVIADKGMISRYIPTYGDYWVTQSDGYIYVNPKNVFLKKYEPFEQKENVA